MVVYANGKGAVNITALPPGWNSQHPSDVGAERHDCLCEQPQRQLRPLPMGHVGDQQHRADDEDAGKPMQTTDPDYSADGKMLAFSMTSLAVVPRAASLYTMRAISGAPATKLTENFGLGLGDRGAAGTQRTADRVLQRPSRNDNLYLVNWDGTAMRQPTSNKADDSQFLVVARRLDAGVSQRSQ